MTIEFACECGKKLRAPENSAGKRARCPKCSAIVKIPQPITTAPHEAADEYDLREPLPTPRSKPRPAVAADPLPPVITSARPMSAYQLPALAAPRSLRSFTYFLLLLALIPLILSSFQKSDDLDERIAQTIAAHPDVGPNLEKLMQTAKAQHSGDDDATPSLESVLALFPNDRLDGALLARDSQAHWIIALAAAIAYFAFLAIAFPGSHRYFKGLLFAGIFTGTAGILLLLFVQWAAFSLPAIRVRGTIGLILLIIRLIGYSYVLAESNFGFIPSFIGFTCGVGLCEEITKAVPLLFRIKPVPGKDDPTWNNMLLWGLASGIGFGIAEGIMYSGRYYNGFDGAGMYAVRFISCVVLHAMWAGAVGITVYRRQQWLHDADGGWIYCFRVVQIVLIPMILHGLYDTLLKQDHERLALLVGLVSFAWLAFQIETQQRIEPAAAAI